MKNVFIFIAGAAIGSAATWIFVKKKYEQLAQEEIDSVKEVFARRNHSESGEDESVTEETPEFSEKEHDKYESIANTYVESTNDQPFEVSVLRHDFKCTAMDNVAPKVITPDEFDEFEDYDKFSLTYYADGMLTDENDCLIEDVEGTVGVDSLTHFGEYEDDSVFVRNDRLKCDYEILLDQRTYSDVLKQKPYLLEDE